MLKVLGRRSSGNVMKVLWALEEMGLDYEQVDVGGKFGGNKEADYLAMNPMGKAPLLVDGDFFLWESNAILCYIATLHPETGMLPTDPQGRADCDRWLYWQAFHLINTIVATRDKHKDADKDIALNFGVLNIQLQDKEYVRGDLSIVDFAISPYLLGRHGQALDYTPFPNVRAWLDRCNELKGIVATVFKPPAAAAS